MLEHEELTERIIQAAIAVHRQLGPGFLEAIYEKALILELRKGGLQFDHQRSLSILYDGVQIGEHRLDLLVEGTIVVELKAVKRIENVHFQIVRSYLKAAGLKHGLLLNFSAPKLLIKRVLSP
jgi:GxxExxY protein